jgi:LysM repeat protein
MTIKRLLLVVVIALLAIGATGCKLPASTPPATATVPGGGLIPGGTEDMGMFERFATQTSQAATAQAGGEQPAVPTNTPVPQSNLPTETLVPNEPAKPTQTRVVIPTATPGLPANYTLKKGEFPYCIARRFNINPADLLQANNLGVNSTVYEGTKLKIPQNARNFPGNRSLHKHPVSYSVRAGDTIYTVACYYGDVDPMAIAQANGLSEPYKLTSGDSIQIP